MSEKKYVVYNPQIPGFYIENAMSWPARYDHGVEDECEEWPNHYLKMVKPFYSPRITEARIFVAYDDADNHCVPGEVIMDYYQAILTVPGVIEQLSEEGE